MTAIKTDKLWQGRIMEIIARRFPDAVVNYTSPIGKKEFYFVVDIAGKKRFPDHFSLKVARELLEKDGILEEELKELGEILPEVEMIPPYFEQLGVVKIVRP